VHDGWIVVPNWDKFQHYRDRKPPWIKTYGSLLHKDEYLDLKPTSRALLHGIWLAYAQTDGVIRAHHLQKVIGMRFKSEHLQALIDAGFVRLRASKPGAKRYTSRARAKRQRHKEKKPMKREKSGEPETLAFPEYLERLKHG
jgi:hypothetical protein